MSQTTSSYSDCVASLRTSLSFLESSVNTLGNGVADFPRLVSVLKSVRVRSYPPLPNPFLFVDTYLCAGTALRTNPHNNPSPSRSIPPRRDIPLHHPPPHPRRAPARAAGAQDRDAQGQVGAQRRPAVVRGRPSTTGAEGQERERRGREEARRRGGAAGQGAEAEEGGAEIQRREAGDGGCAEGEGVAAEAGEGLSKKIWEEELISGIIWPDGRCELELGQWRLHRCPAERMKQPRSGWLEDGNPRLSTRRVLCWQTKISECLGMV